MYIGLPPPAKDELVQTRQYFQAMDNMAKVFAISQGDSVLMLADPLLDPRVINAVAGIAASRGAKFRVFTEESTRVLAVPEEAKALLQQASFVVSTWFCSIIDPFCIALRKDGQRWVKITYFRDLDLLKTPQARFPVDLVGEIIRATASQFPDSSEFDLSFKDIRGSDFSIGFTQAMRHSLLKSNRWRGKMAADEPGCYVHYLACHGPNLWDRTAHNNDANAPVRMSGTIFPTWAVGFEKPWEEKIGCRFESDTIVEVTGYSPEALILRDMLVGGKLIELGCGFNPKAPRHTVYPAGSNAPGALHFGIDLAKPSDYIKRTMPDWEEPPVHMDLITFDSTVHAGVNCLIEAGFLTALRSPKVITAAQMYGDPVVLLETAG
jgi:hypothetical protein